MKHLIKHIENTIERNEQSIEFWTGLYGDDHDYARGLSLGTKQLRNVLEDLKEAADDGSRSQCANAVL